MKRSLLCYVCRKAKATDPCPGSGLPAMCRRCHAGRRISTACKCLTYEEAHRLVHEAEQLRLPTGGRT